MNVRSHQSVLLATRFLVSMATAVALTSAWCDAAIHVSLAALDPGVSQPLMSGASTARNQTRHTPTVVVKYDPLSTVESRHALEDSSNLIRVADERDGLIAILAVGGDRSEEVLRQGLLAESIVSGVSFPTQDAAGFTYYSAPNELSVQFISPLTPAACRALLEKLGGTEVQAGSSANLFAVSFATQAQFAAARSALTGDRQVLQVGAVPLERIEAVISSPSTQRPPISMTQSGWNTELDEEAQASNPLVAQFRDRYPGRWSVSIDRRTFSPALLYGTGIRMDPASFDPSSAAAVRETLTGFVRQNQDIFQLEAYEFAGEPRLAGNTWILDLRLTYEGIPLEEHSRVTIGAKTSGGIEIVQLESVPSAIEATTATVPMATAIATAVQTIRSSSEFLSVTRPSLCIIDDATGTGRLVWRFTLRHDDVADPFAAEFFVHAIGEGDVIHSRDVVYRCLPLPQSGGGTAPAYKTEACGIQSYCGHVVGDFWLAAPGTPVSGSFSDALVTAIAYGTGTAYSDSYGDACTMAASNDSQCALQLESRLRGRWCAVHTSSSSTCLVGSDLICTALVTPSASGFLYHSAVTEFDMAQTTAYYWTTAVHNWSSTWMNGNNGVEHSVTVHVNVCGMPGNAFYSGGSMSYARSDIGGCPNMAISDVIAHEYGHAIDEGIGGILDGAYSEGFGDALAMAFTNQPFVGRGGCPHRDGNAVRLWTDVDVDGCPITDPHCVGHVYAGFTWKLRKLLESHLGTAIGDDTADWLVMHPAMSNPSSIPNALLWTFVCDDNDFDMTNLTPDYCDIVGAAVSRAIPIPKLPPHALQPVVHYMFTAGSNGHDSAFDGDQNPCPHDEASGNADYVNGSTNGGAGAVSFYVGAGSDDDSFITHHKEDLDLVGLATGIAWIKPATGGHDATPGCNWGTVMSKGDNFWFQINQNNDGILFQNEGSGAPGTFVAVPCTITVGAWTQVAFVRTVAGAPDPKAFPRSGGATNVRIYVNGVDVGGGSTLAKPTANLWGLSLGYKPASPPESCEFNGLMDEVQLFPTALTPAEVLAIYNAQKTLYP